MKKALSLVLAALFLLTLSVGGPQPVQAQQGACLNWDVTGEWEYRTALGAHGFFRFQQNLSNGWLTGSWRFADSSTWNDFDSGGVIGVSLGFHPVPGDDWRGTVSADGTRIEGTFTGLTYPEGYAWWAYGQARCIVRQQPPPEGTGHATIWWGDYEFQVELGVAATRSPQGPEDVTRVQRINGPYGVTLIIEAVYYGEDLPNRLRVNNRWNGSFDNLGWLYRAGTREDGGTVYRGTVRIPQRQLGPGERITNEVRVVNPDGNENLVSYVDQFIIDPSGYIRDADTNDPIEGAMATAYKKEGGQWVVWNAEEWKQTNPLVSNDEGHYGWDVPPGDYKVLVTHDCYRDAESAVVTIPPPRTDVHFSLQKTGCSPLELTEIRTTDAGGIPKTGFVAGEGIQYRATVSNTSTSAVTVDVNWTVTDPEGEPVEDLSGSRQYVVASFGAQIAVEEMLPSNATEGAYRLQVSFTHLQQTSERVTQFWVRPGGENVVYLPAVMKNLQSVVEPAGIHGRVTNNGAAAIATELRLRFWDGADWSTAATTNTDGNGRYLFTGVPGLGAGQTYYVRFGHNSTDPQKVSNWYGPEIFSYTAGERLAGGDFDIANVNLLSPAPNATVTLPRAFQWQQRGLAGDTYEMELFDPTGTDGWTTGDLGDVGSFTLGAMPSGAVYGKEYGWDVLVYAAPDSYGVSYYWRSVTFSSAQSRATAPTLERRLQMGERHDLGREREQ